jgi:hypothetical protein
VVVRSVLVASVAWPGWAEPLIESVMPEPSRQGPHLIDGNIGRSAEPIGALLRSYQTDPRDAQPAPRYLLGVAGRPQKARPTQSATLGRAESIRLDYGGSTQPLASHCVPPTRERVDLDEGNRREANSHRG